MSARVKLIRVDNRLLHATIVLNWASFINARFIAIVDPQYEKDPFIEEVLQLSISSSIKIVILSVEELSKFINDDKTWDKQNVIILFKNLSVLYEAFKQGLPMKEVQFPYPASRLMLKQIPVYFSEDDIQKICEMYKNGVKFFYQTTSMDMKDYNTFNHYFD
ncbi:PTS sugar transporter subunit IIB [Candidatus Enterococcus willemsii]|uniref:PTS sorbose transporter subunit IIB n=1 Tax=Candidatus Enterococcus willemsii TaxID=1857215 RepID=A0ABQ6Z1B0_9ENTE|nr:PTS sugar transporter subunit IIB [Enterococcus sp. CU12B]KAF1305148.1 PTS sorbose transporter subunit IIB [Enterococcus sp. CU12B]